MIVKTKIFLGLALFYIAFCVFPLFTRFINPGIPGVIVCLVLICLYSKLIFYNKTFFWFLLYCLVTAFFVYFGRIIKIDIGPCTTFYQLIIEYAFLLPNILIALILIHIDDIKVYKLLGHSSFVLLMLSYVLIMPYMEQMDLRHMALYEDYSTSTAIGYTLLHAYIIIIPALYYCFSSFKNWLHWVYLIGLLLSIYVILKSSITTVIGLLLVVIPISIIISSKNKSKVSLFFPIFLLLLFVMYKTGLLISLLDVIRPYFEGTAVEEKIDSFEILLTTGSSTGSIDVREEKHVLSINSFFSNILIGGDVAGGHSSILDRLGLMGLVGFIPYFMMYYSLCKQWYKKSHRPYNRYYLLGAFSALVLLYYKGIFGQEGNLFLMVLLPVFLLLPSSQRDCNI